jgi:DNA-binding NtrC family response regulator
MKVRSALIGARGEEIFRQWRPDVVLTDLELPDTDGIALLRRLKEADEAPQVIMVGAQGSVARAVEAGQAGAFYFLEKPVTRWASSTSSTRPWSSRASGRSTCG